MRAALKVFLPLHLILALTVRVAAAEPVASVSVDPAAAMTNAAPAPTTDDGFVAAARLLDAMRDQQESNQRTIEALKEQAAAARHQAEITTARLKLIEMTLSERHERELQALQSSSRLNFTVVAIVACFGLLALAVMAFFLFRATNRLAALPQAFAQLTAPGAAVPSAGRFLLAGTTSADANARLLSVVGLLEKKFGDLERAVETTPAVAAPGQPAELAVATANGNGHSHEHAPRSAPATEADALRGLLARGQRQLDEDATDDALRTLDEALALAPRNTDALVKRGKALEKLGRMEDALRCYDRALEIDDSLTIAHLSKGGVYNRLDRFGEALECYERALQTQAAPAATQVAA